MAEPDKRANPDLLKPPHFHFLVLLEIKEGLLACLTLQR